MQKRQKWNKDKQNIKAGDIVLIIDDTSPRNSWPLGRVLETFPDRKGYVCRVKVRTKNSILERPISKLCFLKDMS